MDDDRVGCMLHVHDETHSSIMVAVHIDYTAITTVPCHASHRYSVASIADATRRIRGSIPTHRCSSDKAVGDDELVALFAHIGDICLAIVKRHENNKSKKEGYFLLFRDVACR